MKKGLVIVFFLSFFNTYSQEEIQLSVKRNTLLSRYDVFAKPNFTQERFLIGPTQISIVVPAESPDGMFQIINSELMIGVSQFDIVKVPIAAPTLDFHSLTSLGFRVNCTKNEEQHLFSFQFLDNKCREGVRLFDNNLDPNSLAIGMQGADFRNSIYGYSSKLFEVYSSNYNNNGTVCNDCKEKLIVPFIVQKNINYH